MHNLSIQKRLASQILKTSKKHIQLDVARLEEIKEAITKADIKSLIKDGAINARNKRGISSFRARKRKKQKNKGRRRGPGTIKGAKGARLSQKESWIGKIRAQRNFLQHLKEKGVLDSSSFRDLYMKSKGGFFRSTRHIKIYMQEHGISNEKAN